MKEYIRTVYQKDIKEPPQFDTPSSCFHYIETIPQAVSDYCINSQDIFTVTGMFTIAKISLLHKTFFPTLM